jgi:hypothetical protein
MGLFHDADEFVPQYALKASISPDHLQVRGADTGEEDANQGLARLRSRTRHVIAKLHVAVF